MSGMSNWLKAGLIGAAVLVALNVVECIPGAVCCTWLPEWVTLGCVGALAAYWMAPPRMAGAGAGQGALAGVIAGAIGGLVGLVLAMFGIAVFGPLAALGETLGGLEGAGFDPSVFFEMGASVVGTIVCGTGCYAIGVGIAAGLGALGGLIFAIIRPD